MEVTMKAIGNFLWLIIFGLWQAIGCCFCGIICCITLVGIPLAKAYFRIAGLALLPFKKVVITDYLAYPKGNVVWMALGGAGMAVGYAMMGGILCITIIGIPFAKQFFKLARLSALPYGARVI